MKLPKFTLIQKIDLPGDVNCNFDYDSKGNPELLCDAIKQPTINIENNQINQSDDEWIIKRGNKAISLYKGNENVVIDESSNNVIDYVFFDNKIYPIYFKNGKYIFNGNEYEKYIFYNARKIFLNKDKVEIYYKGNRIEIENGRKLYLSKNYISIVRDNLTVIIDKFSNINKLNITGKYLGYNEIYGDIFWEEKGIIKSARKRTLGICVDEVHLIGEFQGGLLIICGDKLKYYYNYGWRELNYYVESEFFIALSKSYIGLLDSNGKLAIYDNSFSKLIEFSNVSSFTVDNKKIYMMSKNGVIASSLLLENYKPFRVINSHNSFQSPVTINIDNGYWQDIHIENGQIINIKDEEGSSKLIYIEPYEFRKGNLNLHLGNLFFSTSLILNYSSDEPHIEFVDGKIFLATKGGKLIKYPDKNAILVGVIRFAIPTKVEANISINVADVVYNIKLEDEKVGEKKVEIPLNLYQSMDKLPIKINVYVWRKLIDSFEFLLPIVVISDNDHNKLVEEVRIIDNSLYKRVLLKRNQFFEWEEIYVHPADYKGVIVEKEGNVIDLDGSKIAVEKGYKIHKVQKNNYSREYLIFGIENPIEEITLNYNKHSLLIHAQIKKGVPFEIIYGVHSYRGVSEGVSKISFPIEPTYNCIKIRAYYWGFTWEKEYYFNSLHTSLILGYRISNHLKEILRTFGI
ncbi:hypothetical protein DJ530_08660, partial [Sulfolobus sp. E1]